MKEKVIETAGKAWRFLGEKGELDLAQLPKALNEKEPIVFQALGWLAREDKISYASKNKKTFVSLMESELQSFQNLMNAAQSCTQVPDGIRSKKKKSA